jgi:hypothetical protein
MRIRKPSPALVLSIIALVFAMGGSAVAAVSYASNAGRVDGKSAVGAGSSLSHAAGNLVATAKGGATKGQIPAKFLAGVVNGSGQPFVATVGVSDNANLAPSPLVVVPGFGTLSAGCDDQAKNPGREDPLTVLGFTNQAGGFISFARTVGNGQATITALDNNAATTVNVPGANTFAYNLQNGLINLQINGVVRQDGVNTADGRCVVYGSALRIP